VGAGGQKFDYVEGGVQLEIANHVGDIVIDVFTYFFFLSQQQLFLKFEYKRFLDR
jgi:hypothetical protein